MPEHRRSTARRIADLVVLGAFLAVLVAPLVDQFARPSKARDARVELRPAARRPPPPRSLGAALRYPLGFGRWYEDQFGLRDRFLFLHSYLKWVLLGSSPSSRIVQGSGGWAFPEEEETLESHRGARPMSRGMLEAWRRVLEARRAWLATLGIEYLLVVSPSKLSVYPERVPARFATVGEPRLRQWLDHLERHSDLPVLDLEQVVLEAKAADREGDFAFFPLGKHWTDRGAHAGYSAIVRRLAEHFPGMQPLPANDFVIESPQRAAGDNWSNRIYLDRLLRQPVLLWRLKSPRAARVRGELEGNVYVTRNESAPGPTAFLYHDSFSIPMRPWLAEHFSALDCTWSDSIDPARIEQERPSIVIQCYNEFTILRTVPHALEVEDRGARRRRFEGATQVLWRMDPERPAWRMRTTHGRRPPARDGALLFAPTRRDEMLELPALDYPAGADLLLRLEIECAQELELSLHYRTVHAPLLDPHRRVGLTLSPGRQVVHLELPSEPFAGRLALLARTTAPTLRLLAAEVRAARAD